MAMYVVLQFGSDNEAKAFVAAEQRDMVFIPTHPDGGFLDVHDVRRIADYEVMGLFKAPTMYCKCPGGKGRIHAWLKGEKWGWWVCKNCGKPAMAAEGPVQLMRAVVSQARNLIAPTEFDPKVTVWLRGWGIFGRDRNYYDKWQGKVDEDGTGDQPDPVEDQAAREPFADIGGS